MGVTVFDADVLIGFLSANDPHHARAIASVRSALNDSRRWICAVNYSEILVGPIKAGRERGVEGMLGHFGIEVIRVDKDLSERAASVRARTNLKLPDAYALATAIHAEQRNYADVTLATFDERVLAARRDLRSSS